MLLKMVIGTAIILLGMYLKRIWKSWRYTMAPAWDDLSRVLSSLPPGPFARKLYQARQELFVTGPGVRKEAAIWLSRNQAIVDIVINKPSILSRLINVQLKERAHIHLKSALDYTVKSLLSNCDTPKFALNLKSTESELSYHKFLCELFEVMDSQLVEIAYQQGLRSECLLAIQNCLKNILANSTQQR